MDCVNVETVGCSDEVDTTTFSLWLTFAAFISVDDEASPHAVPSFTLHRLAVGKVPAVAEPSNSAASETAAAFHCCILNSSGTAFCTRAWHGSAKCHNDAWRPQVMKVNTHIIRIQSSRRPSEHHRPCHFYSFPVLFLHLFWNYWVKVLRPIEHKNRSFQRHSSQPISWRSTEKTSPVQDWWSTPRVAFKHS